MKRPPLESFLKSVPSPIQKEDLEPEITSEKIIQKLRGPKGDKPSEEELLALIQPLIPLPLKGDDGYTPIKGKDYSDGKSIEISDILPLIENLMPEPISPSLEELEAIILPLIPEFPERAELTPKEVIEKINVSRGIKIKASKVEGLDELEGLARSANRNVQNFISLGGNRQTKLQLNGVQVATGADTLNFIGGTLVPVGDGSTVSYTPPSSGGGGSGYQAPLSGGLTGTNTWTTAPNVIVVDGVPKQKTNTDGTVNWTGTTTTVLSVAPNYDIYATA